MFRFFALFGVLASLVCASAASANVLFEGWFEVFVGNQKIGYLTERYEFTDNKFKCTYYLKTNADGNNITESLKAFAKADLAPISYAYTSKVGDQVKILDATFKGETMSLEEFDGKKKTKSTKHIKKGVFLSQFLLYLILQQKDGLSAGKDYSYNAIAEEDGSVYSGQAFVKDEETVKGKDAFRVLNEFKGDKFIIWVSTHGEPLLTRAPDKNIDVRFAENQAQATKGLGVNLQDLRLLFGKVPGDSGASTQTLVPSEDTNADKGTAGKKSKKKKSPPPGNGVEIKGVPPPKSDGGEASGDVPVGSGPGTGAGAPTQNQ